MPRILIWLHAAHIHAGVEAFYVFEGQVTLTVEGEQFPLGTNEIMVVDATRPHGVFDNGATRTWHMVHGHHRAIEKVRPP